MQMTFKNIVKEQIPPQIIISIIFVLMLAIGYGIWSQETNGTISFSAPIYGMEMYVDGKFAGASKSAGEKMSYQYIEGKHSVIISRGDVWPWTKDIALQAKTTETLHPFFVKKEIKPTEITQTIYGNNTLSENPQYATAIALFENAIIKEEIKAPLSSTKINGARSAEYFPGRNDVLLVAVNDGVFAVETGSTTPRNFMPIYKGTAPSFITSDNGSLLVKDGTSVFLISGFSQ
jgi:hypothetical protein